MISSLHTTIGRCGLCKILIISPGGGRLRTCSCGESFIDQERWSGLYARTGGKVELIETICPNKCEHQKENNEFSHKGNRRFCEFEDVQDYMLKTYRVKWDKDKFDWI